MKLKFEIHQKDKMGIERKRHLELNQDSCLIGRAGTDIILNDPKCSLHHIMLFEDEKGFLNLIDLRSTNGTLVNGARVVKKRIYRGDLIVIGETSLRLQEFEAANATAEWDQDLTRWEFPLVSYKETFKRGAKD